MRFLRLFFTAVMCYCCVLLTSAVAEDADNFETKFSITTTNISRYASATNRTFKCTITAAGTFYINWGDGDTQTLERTTTTIETISHTYSSTGTFTIRFGGVATAYNPGEEEADSAINCDSNTLIASMSGSLGHLFPTLPDGSQPRFRASFADADNLTAIPAGLFDGITGAPVSHMFRSTFFQCDGLTGSIPENLFAGLSGAPAPYMFQSTFNSCAGLTGTIPEKLFRGINGAPAESMFLQTFSGCTGLTGSIPAGLFAGVNGAPAEGMFSATFRSCSKLSGSIPGDLFAGVAGVPATEMYYQTFQGCSGLSGYVSPYLFENITSGSASNMMYRVFYNSGLVTSCPSGTTKYTTGFESNFNNKVSCKVNLTCGTGYAKYRDVCYKKCTFADNMHIGKNYAVTLFGEVDKSGNPGLHVKHGNTVCYVFTKMGRGRLNFKQADGTVYYAVTADGA